MNKHSQIRKIIEKQSSYRISTDPRKHEYRFQIGNRTIDHTAWASVQQSATEDVLDIFMITAAQNEELRTNASTYLDFDSADDRLHSLTEGGSYNAASGIADAESTQPKPASVPALVRPFLAWKIRDEPAGSSQLLVTNRFLETIYSSLPAICQGCRFDQTDNYAEIESLNTPRFKDRSKISIEGKTEHQVAELVQSLEKKTYPGLKTRFKQFFLSMSRLLAYFVPQEHDPGFAAIQLYWGAVYEMLEIFMRSQGQKQNQHAQQYLVNLFHQVENVNKKAEVIHHGVYYRCYVSTSDGELIQQDAISESARLLASMVDALGAVFDMIVEAVRCSRSHKRNTLGHYSNNACKLLEAAKDELIAESTGYPPDENIGSILTPQAMVILLMERLGTGVYGNGSVDITAIFDECLAQLVSLRW